MPTDAEEWLCPFGLSGRCEFEQHNGKCCVHYWECSALQTAALPAPGRVTTIASEKEAVNEEPTNGSLQDSAKDARCG